MAKLFLSIFIYFFYMLGIADAAQSMPIKIKSDVSIWLALKNSDVKDFERNCKSDETLICNLGRFILGKIDAKKFLVAMRQNKIIITEALEEDQSISHYYYQNKIFNPFGNSGYIFSIIDLAYSLSDLYPVDAFITLLHLYKFSEGEYAEYVKEKLIILINGRLNSELKSKLLTQYGKELSDIEEIKK